MLIAIFNRGQPNTPGPTGLCGTGPLGALQELPTELLSIIFTELEDDFITIFCLSLANTRLYELGYLYLFERVQEANNWIGDRLVCLGDYSYPEHAPEGILTSAEMELLNSDWHITESLDQVMEHTCDLDRLCVLASTEFGQKQAKYLDDLSSVEEVCFLELKEAVGGRHYSSSDFVASKEHPWVLCNLTTGEYVRAEVMWRVYLEQKNEDLRNIEPHYGPVWEGGEYPTLVTAIVMRFAWAHYSRDHELPAGRKSISGAWAGHRFEVVPLANMRQLEDGKHWEDVSEEIAKEIRALRAEEGLI